MPLTPGSRLGPYEILAAIGAGGMGEVYRARDTRLGRDVAVKVLPASFATNAERLRRFEQEARTTGMLNHPNILAVFDVGTHEDAPYLVTELLEGQTLRGELPMPRRKALDYAKQVAVGLAAAHAKGVTHRDLKPENLFVTIDGRVKILDFGLAKVAADEANQLTRSAGTTPGVAIGTVGYMSPEQARGQVADHRADIFSFGAILYEMLSGRRAFHHDSSIETLNAILKEDPPPVGDNTLEPIVRRCLEKSAEQRFQSAADLAFAISSQMSSPSDALSSSAATPAVARLGMPRWWMWPAAAFAAFVFLAAGWFLSRWASPPLAWTGEQLDSPEGTFYPRISPDGKLLAALTFVGNQTEILVMKPGGSSWTVLTHSTTGSPYGLAWSADGSQIFFDRWLDVPIGIYSIPALGGEERLLLADAGQPLPLPDGSLLVLKQSAQRSYQIHHFWPQSGKIQPLPAFISQPGSFSVMRAFPDGKEVAFWGTLPEQQSRENLYVLDLARLRPRRISQPGGLRTANDSFPMAATPDNRFLLLDWPDGALHRITAVPRNGGSPQVLLSLTDGPSVLDVASDGSIYLDQVSRPREILRFPVSGGLPEHLLSSRQGFPVTLELPDGRLIIPSPDATRPQIQAAKPGGIFAPLVNTTEDTWTPVTVLGQDSFAFLLGKQDHLQIGVATLAEGRILRRLENFKITGKIWTLQASLDGKTVYCDMGGKIWAVPVAGGQPTAMGEGDSVTVSPRGGDLIVQTATPAGVRLERFPAAGGRSQRIPLPAGALLSGFPISPGAVSPDGRIALSLTAPLSWFNPAGVLDPSSGKMQVIPLNYTGDLFTINWSRDGRLIAMAEPLRSSMWRFHPEGRTR